MRKLVGVVFFLLLNAYGQSQDSNNLWKAYVSYNAVVALSSSEDKLVAASDNAVFTYDFNDGFINSFSTLDGLSGESISTIHYVAANEIIIIGYNNGLIEMIKPDGSVLTVVDIVNKSTIPPNKKRINHFSSSGDLVYIATDFGVSVYDTRLFQFGDTYYLGTNGALVSVSQTTIFEGVLYASCLENAGLKYINLDNPNKTDFSQWQTFPGNYYGVQVVSERLLVLKSDRVVYELKDTQFETMISLGAIPIDFKSQSNMLAITFPKEVQLYDANLDLFFVESVVAGSLNQFTETIVHKNEVFTGTTLEGVQKMSLLAEDENTNILPSGPLMNVPFRVKAQKKQLWVSYGEYADDLNPYPLNKRGVSRLKNKEWTNIPFDSLIGARDLNAISINPLNPEQVFISSLVDGLLELNNTNAKTLFNTSNSTLKPIFNREDSDIRIGASVFDSNGILWVTNGLVGEHLHSYSPESNRWIAYDLSDILDTPSGDHGTNKVVVDANQTVWLATNTQGVVGVRTNGQIKKIKIKGETSNMPSDIVRSLAIDFNNNLWIGTKQGLRVLYNTQGAFDNPNVEVDQIIVEEDGLAQELFFSQFLSAIEVDGSNNKWVGTSDAGVFYVSPDGQQTIYHFTKDNSPLPSNSIVDISIENTTGEVFIATDNGLVSFNSGGTSTEDSLSGVYAYPNPVRPEYDLLGYTDLNNINKGIKLKGLTNNVNIKITDVEGNLVAEAQSNVNYRASSSNFAIDGGTAIWNGKNLRNNVVASGVYLFLISDLTSFETKTVKVLIIR